MFRLVALDVDDTVASDGCSVSGRLTSSITALHELGLRVVLVTGRQYPGIEQLIETLRLTSPQIVVGGAAIIELETLTVLQGEPIEAGLCVRILDYCERVGFTAVASFGRHSIGIGPREHFQLFLDHGIPVPEFRCVAETTGSCFGITVVGADRLDNISDFVSHADPLGDHLRISSTVSGFVDISSQRTSKGSALRWLIQYLGLLKKEVLAIGDSDADVSMFDAAGYSVAVANASPMLLAKADQVVASCDEDGAACAIEELILSGI